jgi:hypothetical protein
MIKSESRHGAGGQEFFSKLLERIQELRPGYQ